VKTLLGVVDAVGKGTHNVHVDKVMRISTTRPPVRTAESFLLR